MPNPFNKQPVEQSTGALVPEESVSNSELWCEQCPSYATEGVYVPAAKRLTFTCPMGHVNVVRGVELD